MDTINCHLETGWKFIHEDVPAAWYKGFDDRHWQDVTIPHDWAVTMPFSQEYASGTGYLAGGVGWYRLRFHIPQEYEGKQLSLVFDGVYKNAKVWCNSYYLGMHPNGYTDFDFDITGLASFGGDENVLVVRVCHMDISDSRWFTGSGITRKVRLRVEDSVHPVRNGVFFSTEAIENGHATITIRNEIKNAAAQQKITLTNILYENGAQSPVCTLRSTIALGENETQTVVQRGWVEQCKPWSPDAPWLYTLKTYVSNDQSDARVYLAEVNQVGIRMAHFDADKGFFLNGSPLRIKGICVHHDGGALGAAMYKEVWQRRLAKLKEAGANALRCAHNPHMPEFYELCDEMGFLVMDEAFDEWENAKNKWWQGHNVYPPKHEGYYENFPQWHETDLAGMVRRDRNHPCVILWSIGNEVDYPNDPYCHPSFQTMFGNNDLNKPAQEFAYDPNKPNAKRLVPLCTKLAAIVKKHDTTRPVLLASAFPELSITTGLFAPLDLVGYNYKEHLYDLHHRQLPRLPILGSENNHDYHLWKAVLEKEYISGQFLWTGIDFLGEAHGWPIHGSGAGLLTTAGFEKPEYAKRQAYWHDVDVKPVANLLTAPSSPDNHKEFCQLHRHYCYQEGEMVHVRCYTNCPRVALAVNGVAQEPIVAAQTESFQQYGFVSWDIPCQPGSISAIGQDETGRTLVETQMQTPGAAQGLHAEQWRAGFSDSLIQIEVTLVDQNGNLVPRQDRPVHVSCDENLKLVSIDNGDLADHTCFAETARSTYQGKLIVYLRKCGSLPGKLTLHADGLAEVVMELA